MNFLHQILPVFVLPVAIVLGLLIAGLKTKRRALLWVALFTLRFFSRPLFSSGLIRMVAGDHVHEPADSIPSADAIVVLSGGSHDQSMETGRKTATWTGETAPGCLVQIPNGHAGRSYRFGRRGDVSAHITRKGTGRPTRLPAVRLDGAFASPNFAVNERRVTFEATPNRVPAGWPAPA